MNTEKKNQHYLPKFYLRNFSYAGNNKQIGLFNLKSSFYYDKATLKTQGSKNFFYGYDGIIENGLSQIEGFLASNIKKIIETEELPKKNTKDYYDLLTFVGLTDLRNPIMVQSIKNSTDEMRSRLLELDPNADINNLIPELNHDDTISLALSGLENVVKNILDLDFKLLINKTANPFICSDFPIIKYNQFLEGRKWRFGKTGYGCTGLQIFIPINSRIMIVFYDPMIYKVGVKKNQNCAVTNQYDIDKLNVLQLINCIETTFFDEKVSEDYIRKLFKSSKGFKRANQTKSDVSYLIEYGKENSLIESGKQNLLHLISTDCEVNLKIEAIRMHSHTKAIKLHPSLAQLRPLPAKLRALDNPRKQN
jgi:hypothetical protein